MNRLALNARQGNSYVVPSPQNTPNATPLLSETKKARARGYSFSAFIYAMKMEIVKNANVRVQTPNTHTDCKCSKQSEMKI